MEKVRISVRIDGEDFQKIQAAIKKEFPALRNISDVVRAALKEFLSNKPLDDVLRGKQIHKRQYR